MESPNNVTCRFVEACEKGNSAIVHKLLQHSDVDIHYADERAFCLSCRGDHLSVVDSLLSLTDQQRINVHANDDEAFIFACQGGAVNVVQRLVDLTGDRKIDIHVSRNYAFYLVHYYQHFDVLAVLLAIDDDRAHYWRFDLTSNIYLEQMLKNGLTVSFLRTETKLQRMVIFKHRVALHQQLHDIGTHKYICVINQSKEGINRIEYILRSRPS